MSYSEVYSFRSSKVSKQVLCNLTDSEEEVLTHEQTIPLLQACAVTSEGDVKRVVNVKLTATGVKVT